MPWRETPAELGRARAEQPVIVSAPAGRLFGIFTPPAPDAPTADLCVVFLTRPRSHRNRMWVEAARRLAALGFATFRFDYRGTGDSEARSAPLDPDAPYREDMVAVIRHLRAALGQRRFVVSGSCFDGRTALSAFPEEGHAIEGLVFMVAPATKLDDWDRANADHKDWGHLARAAGRRNNWQALRRPERWHYMAVVVGRVARRSLGGLVPKAEVGVSRGFRDDFRALLRSGARALFLYGAEDSVYRAFRPAEQSLIAGLDPETRKRFAVEVWPGTMHGFIEMQRQRDVLERVMTWIEAFHPQRAAAGRDQREKTAWTSS
jgi:pimeloyl-ACP methyl ester carboxylesterase